MISRRGIAILKLSRRAFVSSPDIFHTWRPAINIKKDNIKDFIPLFFCLVQMDILADAV